MFFEQARTKTALWGETLRHVQRLAASWQPLADLCFSDLLLLAPIEGEQGSRSVILAQVRPTTGQTVYPMDLVGAVVDDVARPLVAAALRTGEIVEGTATLLGDGEQVLAQCIPVRVNDEVVAVVTRETRTSIGRQLGELEHHYLDLFERFARMIAQGNFPFRQDDDEFEDAPRVGDGVILVDPDVRVRFASPNAVSSLHRMGIHSYTSGLHLAEMGFDQDAVDISMRARLPVTEEVEQGDTSVLVQAIPLLEHDDIVGVLMLLRDVTDLRRRDRLLISKDATIREIHHRVKNNLQTIAALLRLQGRHLQSPEARAALEESERRIRAIAVVHETLSRDPRDVVRFDDIIQPLVRVVQETVASLDADLRFDVVGDAGYLPGDLATPLAVVLNELMQNAVDHAFPLVEGRPKGCVRVHLSRREGELLVDVIDDGVGLPSTFSIGASIGLGLSIVQALVTTELNGTIEMSAGDGRLGTPEAGRTGTLVRLKIPVRQAGTATL
ncbi:MAG TPA: sensor histidine kinase [Acidimicrobiia bacterium]|nr:sensor histidine kinase [Acidimicrobiia bacterium]